MAIQPEDVERVSHQIDRLTKRIGVVLAIIFGLLGGAVGVMALLGLGMPRTTLVGLAGLACIPVAAGMIYMLLHKPPPEVQARMDAYLPQVGGVTIFLVIAGYGVANIFGIFMSRSVGFGVVMLLAAFPAYFMVPMFMKQSTAKPSNARDMK